MTNPLRTAIPERAINPTPAEIDSGIPRIVKAKIPPVNANGIPEKTNKASRTVPRLIKSRIKIPNSVTGTTKRKRLEADCNCSN